MDFLDIPTKTIIIKPQEDKNMNELVKYNNQMNKVLLTGFNKCHMDLFMAICSKAKNHGTNEIIIKTADLKEITQFERGGKRGFFEELDAMTDQLQRINGKIVDRTPGQRKFVKFTIFPTFEYSESEEELTVKVNEKFAWLLNEFENYTVFELTEFVNLNSKYAKHLYRILKQWRTTGKYIFHNLDEFRELMDVPKAYTNRQLMQDCVAIAVAEIQKLNNSFKDFQCEPIYGKKRGKPLEGLEFTWTPEERPKKAEPTEELEGQEKFTDAQSFDEYLKAYKGADKPSAVALKIAKDIEKGNKAPKKPKNSFCNFKQNEYDFEQLEKELFVNW